LWRKSEHSPEAAMALLKSVTQVGERESQTERAFMENTPKAHQMNLPDASPRDLHFDSNASQQLNMRPGTWGITVCMHSI